MNVELKEIIIESIKYWEKKRIFYNLILLVPTFVGYQFGLDFPVQDSPLKATTLNLFTDLALLCIGANICFTFAYIPDLFLQISGVRERWRENRIILFSLGTLFACFLALGNAMMLPWGINWT